MDPELLKFCKICFCCKWEDITWPVYTVRLSPPAGAQGLWKTVSRPWRNCSSCAPYHVEMWHCGSFSLIFPQDIFSNKNEHLFTFNDPLIDELCCPFWAFLTSSAPLFGLFYWVLYSQIVARPSFCQNFGEKLPKNLGQWGGGFWPPYPPPCYAPCPPVC